MYGKIIKASLVLLTIMLVPTTYSWSKSASNEEGVAVIIGNKNYSGRVPEVSFAHRDADAMKQYVVDVLGYDEDNIIDLRDASKAELESAFGNESSHKGQIWQYIDPAGSSDVTVFYSGHGVPGSDGRGYLLPANANPDTAEINGYPIDTLYKNLGKLKTRSVTVMLDACFSGDSGGGMLIESASPIYMDTSLPAAVKGMTVLTAASGKQLASWDKKAQHGLFTHHLLDALYGKGDGNGDGNITAFEVKSYLDKKMTRAARRTYRREQDASFSGNADLVMASASEGTFAKRPTLNGSSARTVTMEDMDDTLYALKSANVRSGPATSNGKIDRLSAGDEVEVTGKLGDWYRILLADGKTGFVFGKLLTATAPKTVAAVPKDKAPTVGDSFKDCADCPELVVVPAGSFSMGSNNGDANEKPVHRVTIAKPLAVGKFEVTKSEFATFVRATGYDAGNKCWVYNGKWEELNGRSWKNPSFSQTDRDPVTCMNWQDAKAYVDWIVGKTGKSYRLLSESEWEYVARAGSQSKYSFGNSDSAMCSHGNGAASETAFDWKNKSCRDGYTRTAPVGSFTANAFGLHDMHGNVYEWVEDCYSDSYHGARSDGIADTSGSCEKRVLRGGSWRLKPRYLRSASRTRLTPDTRYNINGFRVVRTF